MGLTWVFSADPWVTHEFIVLAHGLIMDSPWI